MRYAVAHINFFDNELKIVIVNTTNPINAIVRGVKQIHLCCISGASDGNPDLFKWLDSFLVDIPDPNLYGERIETIKEEFFNADQAVEVMLIG